MRAHRLVTALALSVGAALAVPAGTQAAPLPEHGYVTNTYVLPVTTNQADRLGRDLDGDGTRDNALGRLFPVLAQQGLDLTTAQQAAVTAGSTVMLHSLRTTRLTTTKDATWQVFLGTPTESPDLTGSGTFPIGPATTRSKKLPATITDHKVKTATGVVPVQLDFGIGAFELTLTAARITATCTRTGCTGGHITGAVTRTQRDLVFLPRLADLVQAVIVRDCPGPDPSSCLPDAQGGQLQQQFDANDDMVVTADELAADPLVASVLAPDLDLERRDGSPGHDGVKDSLSFGAGFTTVSATLDRG
jgi:hypothetical protein